MAVVEICISNKPIGFKEKKNKFRGFTTNTFLKFENYYLGINLNKQLVEKIIKNKNRKKLRSLLEYVKAAESNSLEVKLESSIPNITIIHKLTMNLKENSISFNKLQNFIKNY